MRKVVLGATCFIALLLLQACEPSTKATREHALVCEVTPLDHPSLGAATAGFEEGLFSKISRADVEVRKYNAGGNMDLVGALLEQTVNDKCRLVFVVTTPAATKARLLVASKGVPVVYTAVTDPVGANIVSSMDGDELPITGVTDRFPVEEQVDLFMAAKPDTKIASILMNPTEQNSQILSGRTQAALEQRGVKVRIFRNADANNVSAMADTATNETDIVVVNGDNLFTEHLEVVVKLAELRKVPLFVGEPDSVRRGGVATVGPSYRALGFRSGEKAADVLNGEFAGKIPSENPSGFEIYINAKAAKRYELDLPDAIWSRGEVWSSSL